jgi:hypothetical protein
MTKIAVAAVLLLGTMPLAHAQGTGRAPSGSTGASTGASQLSPGHQMQSGMDRDDRGPGASGYSPGHERSGTVGQSRGARGDLDRDAGGRKGFGRDTDDHRTTGQSRRNRDSVRSRGDSDRGASELSPGSRMREGGTIDRR